MRISLNNLTKSSKRVSRRGAVLVIVMICLLIVSLLMASLLKSALLQRRQTMKEQFRVQAEWILESALERAALQRLKNPEYQGEVWKISSADLGTRYLGSAEITLKATGVGDSLISIQARVKYPEKTILSVTRTKKIIL
jgi:type II secretory pathway pseudopilin PulG